MKAFTEFHFVPSVFALLLLARGSIATRTRCLRFEKSRPGPTALHPPCARQNSRANPEGSTEIFTRGRPLASHV